MCIRCTGRNTIYVENGGSQGGREPSEWHRSSIGAVEITQED